MKKCKHCQSEIDSNAKICPNCRKKQGMPIWLIVILVIIGIGLISSIASSDDSDTDKPAGTTDNSEKLSLLDDHVGRVDDEWTYEINGTIKNNTNEELEYVSVEFYAYDNEGNLLDTCEDYIDAIEANGSWKFSASCWLTDGKAHQVTSYKLKEITHW